MWVRDNIDVEKWTWKLSRGGSLRLAGMEVEQSMPQSMLLGVEGRGLGMLGRIWC